MDFYISGRFSLIVPINGYYHFNSDLNDSSLLLGAGLRYYFRQGNYSVFTLYLR